MVKTVENSAKMPQRMHLRFDPLAPEERSRRMALIRSKNTGPEWRVRRIVHGMGFRYRLHRRDLPGCPDLVFPSRRKIIFVHGCFWHRHKGCSRCRLPKSRQEFWAPKLERNRIRDRIQKKKLKRLGWDVLVIWECQTEQRETIASIVSMFLGEHP
jgi:DNA mismatch endonuclease (patch repair protein)